MSEHPRLIGLYSPQPKMGKSTVAKALAVSMNGMIIVHPFAAVLKDMAESLFSSLGYGYEELAWFRSDGKHYFLPELQCSVRHVYQTLGTEWGRQLICDNLWIKCWRARVQSSLDMGFSVIADDMRFPNEAETVRDLGGELWCVTRQCVGTRETHVSEGALDGIVFDRVICNNSDLQDLQRQVEKALAD